MFTATLGLPIKILKAGELSKKLTGDTRPLTFFNHILPKQMKLKNNITNQAVKGMRQLTCHLGRPGGRWMTTRGNSRGKPLVCLRVMNVGNRLYCVGPDHHSTRQARCLAAAVKEIIPHATMSLDKETSRYGRGQQVQVFKWLVLWPLGSSITLYAGHLSHSWNSSLPK